LVARIGQCQRMSPSVAQTKRHFTLDRLSPLGRQVLRVSLSPLPLGEGQGEGGSAQYSGRLNDYPGGAKRQLTRCFITSHVGMAVKLPSLFSAESGSTTAAPTGSSGR
jgi:hypothetical protein